MSSGRVVSANGTSTRGKRVSTLKVNGVTCQSPMLPTGSVHRTCQYQSPLASGSIGVAAVSTSTVSQTESLKSDRRARASLFFRLSGAARDRIDEVLGIIALEAARDRIAGGLSHGQKQWLEIGMLLMQEPDLLLVDEPVAGMTDAETEQTAALLREISRTSSVVVVEHDMEFVRSIANKVTVLHQGSVLAEGTMDQGQSDPKVVEVYLGTE